MVGIAGIALLLLVAFLPGLAFRRLYFTGPFSKQYGKPRLDGLLVAAFVPALPLQLLGRAWSAAWGTWWFYELLSARLFGSEYIERFAHGASGPHPVRNLVLQQLVLVVIGAVAGLLCRTIVRNLKLDIRFKTLRFDNVWQYILRGEMYGFPEIKVDRHSTGAFVVDPAKVDGVTVDILVSTAGQPVIYKGELVDYHLGADSTIKYLIMSNVSRRSLAKDPEELAKRADEVRSTAKERFYAIPGHALVFKGEHILNINVHFARMRRDDGKDLYAMFGEPPRGARGVD